MAGESRAIGNLGAFITVNRDSLILRCRARAAKMAGWPSTQAEVERGIPLFLNQLVEELAHDASQTRAIRNTAVQHGQDLYYRGFTVSQVVHDYGNVCQSVTDLAVELAFTISTDDFRTLNRCLDDAIAGAVSEYSRQQLVSRNGQSHDLWMLVNAALVAFEILRTGRVGVAGATGDLVARSLTETRTRLEGPMFRQPAGPA
jgi:hypothetical protein